MDGPPAQETAMQRIDKKTSPLSMLACTMAFTFFAGMFMDTAVVGLIHARTEYRGPENFAFGLALVFVAFRWGLSLWQSAKLNEGVRA